HQNYYDLSHYIDKLKLANLFVKEELFDIENQTILHLEQDSKKVEPGTLFDYKGCHFKIDYLKEAIKRGYIAYISEEEYDLEDNTPHLTVSDIRLAIPLLAETFYNHPQEKLKIVAVGGTKGKTTTSYFVKAILDTYLNEQGKAPAGLISSLTNIDGDDVKEGKLTSI